MQMTQSKERPELTFAYLEAEIEKLPEGPISVFNQQSQWSRWSAVIGVLGVLMALMPSLLIHWLEPAWWMVKLARIGLVITIAGFLPGFVRNIWVFIREIRHHRRGLIEQFDHDTKEIRGLAKRLAIYPRETLERQRRFARMGYDRLGSRLVMMLGGIERLGLFPLLLSLFVLLRNWQDLLALPSWLAMLAVMVAVLWVIGWLGAEFRRRLQLYEFLLDEALIAHDAVGDGKEPRA